MGRRERRAPAPTPFTTPTGLCLAHPPPTCGSGFRAHAPSHVRPSSRGPPAVRACAPWAQAAEAHGTQEQGECGDERDFRGDSALGLPTVPASAPSSLFLFPVLLVIRSLVTFSYDMLEELLGICILNRK
jgi:hypothetical protein